LQKCASEKYGLNGEKTVSRGWMAAVKRVWKRDKGDEMFKLEEKHLDAAKEIARKHRQKKSCDNCYERGWIGTTDQNLLVLCTRCVDMDAAMEEWKTYVSGHEDLKEHFSELFEEKPVTEDEEERVLPPAHEHKKETAQNRQSFIPGQRRPGHTKKIG
jgi:hypothetical protein